MVMETESSFAYVKNDQRIGLMLPALTPTQSEVNITSSINTSPPRRHVPLRQGTRRFGAIHFASKHDLGNFNAIGFTVASRAGGISPDSAFAA